MTDAPVVDAAPVAAPSSVPVEPSVNTPAPLESSHVQERASERVAERTAAQQAEKAAEAAAKAEAKEPPKPAKNAGEAVRNAMAKVKGEAAEAKKVEAKPADVSPTDTKPGTITRDGVSTIEAKPKYEAPSRFAEDAKADWAKAPETVHREVDRAIRELTQGHEKYKQAAERDTQLERYHRMAQQGGKPLAAVIEGYWQAEQAIRANPVQGLDAVCRNLGFSLKDIAAHVMGQPPEQHQAAADAEVRQLRQTVQMLQQQLGGVTQTIQQQRESAVLEKINSFAKEHPRYAELEPQMVKLIEIGIAKDLADAYAKAERLNPAPPKVQLAAASPAAPAETAQTRESKSISGAPDPGSSPAEKRRSSSIRESLRRAAARAG